MNSTKTQISRREFKYQIPCWDHLGQSHRRFQNSSPKAQVPRFRALAEPKVQDTEPKTQEADAKMSCGDPSFQDPRFNSQKPLDFLGWRPSDTRIQNPSPRDQRFPLVCPYTKSKSQDVQGCRSQVGFRIGHYSWAESPVCKA